MCIMTIALGAHEDYPFVLTHNRDEFFARATTPLCEQGGILCASDEQSGGTWLGVNVATGAVAALTNVRALSSRSRRSRGELVMRVLAGDAKAATTSNDYSQYNLVFGTLSKDGAPPSLQLAVSAPPDETPRSRPLPRGNVRPFVATKSNDHGGGMTTAQSDPQDACTWPKATWLCDSVTRALASDAVQQAKGETGARGVLLDALEPLVSARCIQGSPSTASSAMQLAPHTPLRPADEQQVQAAPFVTPFELRPLKGPEAALGDCSYGTVSQTLLVQCKSERCLLYGYREMAPKRSAADDEGAAAAGRRGEKRRLGSDGAADSAVAAGGMRTRRQCAADAALPPAKWTWRRVEL